MKITTLDRRSFIVTKEEALGITSKPNITVKINGNDYYLATCVSIGKNLFQTVFISNEPIEIELEMESE